MQTTARHRARTKARPAPEEPKPAPRTPPPTLIQLVWREGRLVVLPWPSAGADPTPAPLCSASWTSLEAAKAELPAVLGVPFEVVYQEPAPLPVPDLATRRREAGRLHRAQEAEETRLASKLEDNSERPTDGGEELREAKELLAPLQALKEQARRAYGTNMAEAIAALQTAQIGLLTAGFYAGAMGSREARAVTGELAEEVEQMIKKAERWVR